MKNLILTHVILLPILFLNFSTIISAQVNASSKYLELGDYKVYKLQDTQFLFSVAMLGGIEKEEAAKIAGKDSLWTPVNGYLIKTPTKNILVDAGTGSTSAQLIKQLQTVGITPDKIDLIYLTHFHQDHIGGLLTPDGKRVFPNAIVRASKKENDYWLNELTDLSINVKQNQNKIKASFAPYILENAYKPFSLDEDLGNGMKAMLAVGHTPGHTIYSITSEGKELWCIGDLIHIGAVQFARPNAFLRFDSDSPAAIKTRIEFFNRIAKDKIIIAGVHLSNFFLLNQKDNGFEAIPINLHD